MGLRFRFGDNWARYSKRYIDDARLGEVRESLASLVGLSSLCGKTFLDIGFGSGIFSIAAQQLGADVVGIDIDPRCTDVAKNNAKKWLAEDETPTFLETSVLDEIAVSAVGEFDIVYAWGSLHHTGNMKKAIRVAADRVAPGGLFVIAIYNKHFTSPVWRFIKMIYNVSPQLLRGGICLAFAPIIATAKFAATGKNPLRNRRGMHFVTDLVDWLGGYPYEYAAPDEIIRYVAELGLTHDKLIRGATPIACNEYVFRRTC